MGGLGAKSGRAPGVGSSGTGGGPGGGNVGGNGNGSGTSGDGAGPVGGSGAGGFNGTGSLKPVGAKSGGPATMQGPRTATIAAARRITATSHAGSAAGGSAAGDDDGGSIDLHGDGDEPVGVPMRKSLGLTASAAGAGVRRVDEEAAATLPGRLSLAGTGSTLTSVLSGAGGGGGVGRMSNAGLAGSMGGPGRVSQMGAAGPVAGRLATGGTNSPVPALQLPPPPPAALALPPKGPSDDGGALASGGFSAKGRTTFTCATAAAPMGTSGAAMHRQITAGPDMRAGAAASAAASAAFALSSSALPPPPNPLGTSPGSSALPPQVHGLSLPLPGSAQPAALSKHASRLGAAGGRGFGKGGSSGLAAEDSLALFSEPSESPMLPARLRPPAPKK